MKLLEENIGVNICGLGLDTKSTSDEKINKLYFIKI